MELDALVAWLHEQADPDFRAGMARFGIPSGRTLGIRIPRLRAEAKRIGRSHDLALAL